MFECSLVDRLRFAGAVGFAGRAAFVRGVRPAFVVEAEIGLELEVSRESRSGGTAHQGRFALPSRVINLSP